MIRRLVAGLIVVGLAVGVWVLWPRGDSNPTATTLPDAVASTTTTTLLPVTTTSTPATTSSTVTDSHVVTTVEEAEAILRELWFGWFEGIYNQDEERIKEVVGTQAAIDEAISQFNVMQFEHAPVLEEIQANNTELLRTDEECIALYTTLTISGFRDGSSSAVHVVRRLDDRWVSVGLWQYKDDLWSQDCEGQLESL